MVQIETHLLNNFSQILMENKTGRYLQKGIIIKVLQLEELLCSLLRDELHFLLH